MQSLTGLAATACALALAAPLKAQDNSISVLHYWTSGGEAAAVSALRKVFEDAGGTWIDERRQRRCHP